MGLCFIPYRGAVILYMSKETRMLNPSAVLYGPHDVRIEDRPVPEPAPGQVLVEIAAVGICGSDVHYYEHGRIGDYVVRDPMIIGHESRRDGSRRRRRRRPKQGRRAGRA